MRASQRHSWEGPRAVPESHRTSTRSCKGTVSLGTAVTGGEKGGRWRRCEGNIGHRYLQLPCLPEIPNLECGTSGFGWLEGCGVRGWRIGPRRPELFSPTGSSGSSLPRSVETGRPLDVNTQSPCLDRPVAPTQGRYLRGSCSQFPWALRAGQVSGLLGHKTPHSRVKTSSPSIESKGCHSY